MVRYHILILRGFAAGSAGHAARWRGESDADIDRETLDKWSAPYRGWHYQPEHVIPAQPNVPGYEKFHSTDVPVRLSVARATGQVLHELHRLQRPGLQLVCRRKHESGPLDQPPAGDGLRAPERVRPRRVRHRRVSLRILRHQGAASAEETRRQVLDAVRLLPASRRLRIAARL